MKVGAGNPQINDLTPYLRTSDDGANSNRCLLHVFEQITGANGRQDLGHYSSNPLIGRGDEKDDSMMVDLKWCFENHVPS